MGYDPKCRELAEMSAHTLTNGCGREGCRGCALCDARFCTACALPTGALTTDCCGQEVTESAVGRICDGKLDHRDGRWVAAMCPAQQEAERLRQINRRAVKGEHAGAFY